MYGLTILTFLLQTTFDSNKLSEFRLSSFVAGIKGFLLCIPWLSSYLRSSEYHYIFRMAQAKEKEPLEWNLLKNIGEKFSAGEIVQIGESEFRINGLARVLRTKISVPLLIYIFAAVYLAIVIVSGPWWE